MVYTLDYPTFTVFGAICMLFGFGLGVYVCKVLGARDSRRHSLPKGYDIHAEVSSLLKKIKDKEPQ